ncbi:MAG: nuclear transport factor 2 family protein [Gammaproteobacteria bacterium]|nr:nuclear transport factor 2 family protein [Gammaproteobacteria bacterium]NNL99237.1 nuclear transport factor 2 family protein [Gammaproteobacteria bacterium]
MNVIERFTDYAKDFEVTLRDDNWERLEAYFTEDAVYDSGPDFARGREAILQLLRNGVDSMDRRMDSRQLEFEPFQADGDTVSFGWTVTYKKAGCPDLVVTGREFAVFEGDRIAELRDEYAPGVLDAFSDWLSTYGARLRE